jgi:hypothetical protein
MEPWRSPGGALKGISVFKSAVKPNKVGSNKVGSNAGIMALARCCVEEELFVALSRLRISESNSKSLRT